MTEQLEAKMAEAQMDAVMVAAEMPVSCIIADKATYQTIARGQGGSAVAAAAAYAAAERWVESHPAEALVIIETRIAKRAARAAAPMSSGAARALRGED